jgi:hypothetical protein
MLYDMGRSLTDSEKSCSCCNLLRLTLREGVRVCPECDKPDEMRGAKK